MLFKAVILSAALAATTLGAALPSRVQSSPEPANTWPPVGSVPNKHIWGGDISHPSETPLNTPAYAAATDDAWAKIDLVVPITMFGRTSYVAWVSMNGIFTIDEPDMSLPTLPERPLPVDPASCKTSPGGCIPETAILPFWADLVIKPGYDFLGVSLLYSQHVTIDDPLAKMQHHHLDWFVCDKAVSMEPLEAEGDPYCGKASRYASVTWGPGAPGIILLQYVQNKPNIATAGTIGIQSPNWHMSVPASSIFTGNGERTTITIDTNALNYTISHDEY
ncbi:hypothetical protein Dda_3801 [Drechslerella dactyloides]|uniref:Uncharacterized protein n=1 Tax=Drechslerella dactyloides TaxID=74499 RepID=A0AAD6J0X6_DREDA|nr:hypothetical protein Dda_3801 [Drechslerella dactyloides]